VSVRNRLIPAFLLFIPLIAAGVAYAYVVDNQIHTPPNYSTFTPPAAGGSYTDAVFNTAVKRLSDSMHTLDAAWGDGRQVTTISTEYSTMSPFNQDNTRLLLQYLSYFALYDGGGNYLANLPFEISASAEPRWSRRDPNVLYYRYTNQLKQYNAGTRATSVVHTFSEYSTISGKGESDIGFDGDHFVFAGDSRYVFVYEMSSGTKGPVLDSGGRAFDGIHITPNNNVLIGWYTAGTSRFNGVELFDRNMNFIRQEARAIGHMDVTRDADGSEVMVWANAADPAPVCNNGVVKIRLSDAAQKCLATFDWSLAVHVSATDNSGWVFVETYAPGDPIPPSGWFAYTNELMQIKLDGSQIRRLAHHRSRPFNSYSYMPRLAVSRDGGKLAYSSNYGLQQILGSPAEYSDAYMIDMTVASPDTIGTASGGTTGGGGPTTTRVEETNGAVSYRGPWSSSTSDAFSGRSAVKSANKNARATFTFTGIGASWIGYEDAASGIAEIYVDGVLKATVDTYAATAISQPRLYSISGLASGQHTLAINVTGTRNAQSTGAWVWVDGFDYTH